MDTAELRRLLAAATPGPWCVGHSAHHTGYNIWQGDTDGDITSPNAHLSAADAALIVAAVNALPALLDRIEALGGALRHMAKGWPMDEMERLIVAALRAQEEK